MEQQIFYRHNDRFPKLNHTFYSQIFKWCVWDRVNFFNSAKGNYFNVVDIRLFLRYL